MQCKKWKHSSATQNVQFFLFICRLHLNAILLHDISMVWQNFLMNEDIYISSYYYSLVWAVYIQCRNRRMPAGAVYFLMTIWNCRIFYGYFKWISSKKSDEEAAVRVARMEKKNYDHLFDCMFAFFCFFLLVSSGRKSRIYFRTKFISMRKKEFAANWDAHNSHEYTQSFFFAYSVSCFLYSFRIWNT